MKNILLSFILLFCQNLLAQDFDELNNLMLENYKAHKYNIALDYAKKALRIAEEKFSKNSEVYTSSLNSLALIYMAMDSLDNAEIIIKEGINICENNNFQKLNLIYLYSELGSIYKIKEDYKKAEENYKKAYILYESSSYPRNNIYYNILKNYGECNVGLENYNIAEDIFNKCLDFLNKNNIKDSNELIEINGTLAFIYRKFGDFVKSENYYLKTIDLLKNSNNYSVEDYAYYINGLASLYHSYNNYEKAEKLYNEAKEIRLKIYGDSSASYAQSLNNLAVLYHDLGRYNEAEKLYKAVLKIWEKKFGPNDMVCAIALDNLAILYITMGRGEDAINLFFEALNIRKKILGEESISYAISLNNVSVVLKNKGYYEEAERLLKKVISIYESKNFFKNPNYLTSLSNLASVLDVQNKYKESEELYLKVLETRKELLGANSLDYASTLHNLGILYFRNQDYEKADKYLTESIEIKKKILGQKHLDYILSVNNLARLKEVKNEYFESKKLWIESLDLYMDLVHSIFPFLSEKEKTKFYSSIKEKFEIFNSFVLRNYRKDSDLLIKLVDYQLVIKGLLLNSIKKMKDRILSTTDVELKSLYNNWISTKEQIALLFNKSADNHLKLVIDSLENVSNELEKTLSSYSEKYNIESNINFTFDSIRNKLKYDEVAIDVIRFKYNYVSNFDSIIYAFVIIDPEKKYPDIIYYYNGNDLEDKYFNDYINLIRNRITEKGSYKRFIDKLEPFITKKKNIYYSPDGVYNKINLSTLMKTDGSYPFRNVNLYLITSLRDIYRNSYEKKSKLNAVLIGAPEFYSNNENKSNNVQYQSLPGTEKEIVEIGNILNKMNIHTKIFLKKDANVKNLKNLKNPSILHIATHGFFKENFENFQKDELFNNNNKLKENPLLLSGLILSDNYDKLKDTTGYSIITSYEVMNLDLDSTLLVVLSACETGLGEVNNGEGVYGLQRAFIVAGAKYIVMSLWKVDDEITSKLMIEFYNNLSKNFDVRRSFIEAQNIISLQYKEPFYWGGFIILGI